MRNVMLLVLFYGIGFNGNGNLYNSYDMFKDRLQELVFCESIINII